MFAASLALCSSVSAVLPFNASKGTTKYFQNPQSSFTFGLIGLHTDIVKNMRFGFVESFVYDKEGRRSFVGDKGNNPHWNIAKILFPSVNGELGIDSLGRDNFSKHATFETLATLMMVVADVRQILENTNDKQLNRFSQLGSAALFKQSAFKDVRQRYQKSFEAQGTSKRYEEDVVLPLLYNVSKALIAEQKGTSPFPRHTTELLISSFLCMKADTLADVTNAYLKALDHGGQNGRVLTPLVNTPPATRFQDVTSLEESDVREILGREALKKADLLEPIISSSFGASSSDPANPRDASIPGLDLDALYGVFVFPFFSKTTPYVGSPPSHGPANLVFGPEATVSTSDTFSDCNENKLRVLLNLMAYNYTKQLFDLSFLNGITGPRADLLRAFYDEQPVDQVGAVSLLVRTAWNRVVGDLNSLEEPMSAASSSWNPPAVQHVRYLRGQNELDSGFANVLRVFEKILGKSFLPSFSRTAIDVQKQEINQGFMRLFSFIAPDRRIALDFLDLKQKANDLKQKANDLAGSLRVTVDNIFQFVLFEGAGTHGHVEGLISLTLKDQNEEQRLEVMRAHEGSLHHGVLESMLLLDPHTALTVRNPFYHLVSQKILGNNEAAAFLKKLSTMEERQDFVPLLRYVLSHVAWDDVFMQGDIAKALLPLLSQPIYQGTLFEEVRAFETTPQYPLAFVLAHFPHITHLSVAQEGTITFDRHTPHLHRVHLSKGARVTGLENLPALNHLSVSDIQEPSLAIEGSVPSLTKLTLSGDMASLSPLPHAPSLEVLDLHGTHVASLHFDRPMPNLTSLSLPDTLVHLTGIERLSTLVSLPLNNTQVASVHFDAPMPNLTYLAPSTAARSLTGLAHLRALTTLHLQDTDINALHFDESMPNLTSLTLPKSLTRLTGIGHLHALQDIPTRNTQVTSIDFEGPMPNLRFFFLPDTLTHLTGIHHLQALSFLHLGNTQVSALHIDAPMPNLIAFMALSTLAHVTGVENMRALQCLPLDNTQVSTLHIDAPMPNLKDFRAPSTLTRLTGMENLCAVNALDLGKTQVSAQDLSLPMPNLKTLVLPSTMTQLPDMAFFPALETLSLINTSITGVRINAVMPHLTCLILSKGATHLEGLENLPSLSKLCVHSPSLTIKGHKEAWEISAFEESDPYLHAAPQLFTQNPSGISWVEEDA
ncbi:MAG: hypothetical protein LCH26_01070 [Proteobacteria bacterium]|nr:hypothetical protein [Pseudomonadota bacterium]